MKTLEDMRRDVLCGVLHLTATEPEWWEKVNLALLDMNYAQYCVLGQIEHAAGADEDGNYYTYLIKGGHSDAWAECHGFLASPGAEKALQAVWLNAIYAARAAVGG